MRRADHTLLVATLTGLMLIAMLPLTASADYSTALMNRVESALRRDRRLNGASCYTAAPGVIVLYGKVFDNPDRELAQATAANVRGVRQVVNTLRTETGQWQAEESRINDTLLLNDFNGVSVRVIASQAYVSGQVSTEAEKQRAVRVIESMSNLQVVNFIRVVPGSILSTTNFF